MLAKRFFYVCAGIFLLALTYHLGSRNATAQAPAGYECVGVSGAVGVAIINRELWIVSDSGVENRGGGPIPSPARVLACSANAVVLENGEVWKNTQVDWVYQGALPFSGPTPATQETWGGVKARYR